MPETTPPRRSRPTPVGERVVVVTGAASGVGYATAELFRDLGDTVLALDVQQRAPEGTTYVGCDVADRASVDAAIATCAAVTATPTEIGRIDVLANVAGVVQFGRFAAITEAEWDRVHAIDLKGPFQVMQAALPHLVACRGNIVNVASVAGRVPQPYTTAYAAAKGGLVTLSQALALELAPDRVRVNVICPGTVDTPIVDEVAAKLTDDLDPRVADRLVMMLPGGNITPAEIGSAIVYLASPEARMVTGAVLAFDGGMS